MSPLQGEGTYFRQLLHALAYRYLYLNLPEPCAHTNDFPPLHFGWGSHHLTITGKKECPLLSPEGKLLPACWPLGSVCRGWPPCSPVRSFLRPVKLPTTDTGVPGKVECGIFLPQTPAHMPTSHPLSPPLSLSSWGIHTRPCHCWGGFSTAVWKSCHRGHAGAWTSARAHTHTRPLLPLTNTAPASHKAALSFHPADSASLFLKIHSCSLIKTVQEQTFAQFSNFRTFMLWWDPSSPT